MSIQDLLRDLQETRKVIERGEEAKRSNSSLKAHHADRVQSGRESMSEREFVRSFGDKVKKVRWSQRADFVGLTILGRFQGITITLDDKSGERKVRLVDVDNGMTHVTKRYLRVKSHDSISNLQRGLLKYVR